MSLTPGSISFFWAILIANPEPPTYFTETVWPSFLKHHPPEVLEGVVALDGTLPPQDNAARMQGRIAQQFPWPPPLAATANSTAP